MDIKPDPKIKRQCSICRHPDRAAIEAAMARGIGRRTVAKRFGVMPDSAGLHWRKHVSNVVKVSARTKWIAPKVDLAKLVDHEADGVLVHLQKLRNDLLILFEAAKADGHFPSIASISRELRGVLAQTAELTGELREANKGGPSSADIATSKEYLDLRSRLLSALRRFPEAQAAVMAEFAATEAKATEQMTGAPMIEAEVHVVEATE